MVVAHNQAREADIRALSELNSALDKKVILFFLPLKLINRWIYCQIVNILMPHYACFSLSYHKFSWLESCLLYVNLLFLFSTFKPLPPELLRSSRISSIMVVGALSHFGQLSWCCLYPSLQIFQHQASLVIFLEFVTMLRRG